MKKLQLWQKILIGMILGAMVGLILGGNSVSIANKKAVKNINNDWVAVIDGQVFVGNKEFDGASAIEIGKNSIEIKANGNLPKAQYIDSNLAISEKNIRIGKQSFTGSKWVAFGSKWLVASDKSLLPGDGAGSSIAINEDITVTAGISYVSYLQPFGTIFVNMIKMLIVPLILFSIISGITSMNDPKMMGRMGIKALITYTITTMFAVTFGIIIVEILSPGSGAVIEMGEEAENISPGIVNMLISIVPNNPFDSMTQGNVLQIIFFAILTGISINFAGKKAEQIVKINDSLAEVMYSMTNIVMSLAPYGVFALIAYVTGMYGIDTLKSLFMLVLTVYIGCLLQIFLVYSGIIRFIINLPLKKFYRKIIDAQILAYTTSSSAATLPVTMKVATNRLGVSKTSSSFILPLGTTINMDGTAMYMAIAALFVAQATGIEIGLEQYLTIILTTTLFSIGAAGIPGASALLLPAVLFEIGVPGSAVTGAIGMILAVDRIMDMIRTTVNVTGDATVALLIDKSEGTFDKKIYLDDSK